ncbi:MAG TPA: DUF4234 domain-containing protein [Candidatus Dormibacteraeota bacterium]|jgi:hypothetical protein
MADNTAHVPAGPESHPTDVDVTTAALPQGTSDSSTTSAAPQPVATDTEAIAADVELVGRTSGPVARLGAGERAAVLVGAASAVRVDEAGSQAVTRPPAADPRTRRADAPEAGGDLPVWSFRDAVETRELAPPAPVDRHQAELLFTPVVESITSPPRPQPLFGPVGRPRSSLLVPLLAVVTLGVYALVWHHRVNRELEEFDPKLHSRPVRSAVAVAVPWLIGLLVTLAGAAFLVGARLSIHIPLGSHVTTAQAYALLAGLATVPYLILVLPFSLVAIVMTLERLRCVEEHVGTTTDRQVRPVGSSLLLAIPVAGGLLLLGVEQRRLNAIWDAMAPAGRVLS